MNTRKTGGDDDNMAASGTSDVIGRGREFASPKCTHRHQHQHPRDSTSRKAMDIVAAAQGIDSQPIWGICALTGFLVQATVWNNHKRERHDIILDDTVDKFKGAACDRCCCS